MTLGLAGVSAILFALGVAPLIRAVEDPATRMIAWGMAAVSAAMVVACVAVLVPRVPRRRPGQSLETYWADSEGGPRLLLVWFLSEGAAVLALVGFLLSGHPAPVAAAAIAMAALAWWTPGRFTDV